LAQKREAKENQQQQKLSSIMQKRRGGKPTWPRRWHGQWIGGKTRPRPDGNYAAVWQIAKGFILWHKVVSKLACLLVATW